VPLGVVKRHADAHQRQRVAWLDQRTSLCCAL
jgi:hypothetical protein